MFACMHACMCVHPSLHSKFVQIYVYIYIYPIAMRHPRHRAQIRGLSEVFVILCLRGIYEQSDWGVERI